MPAIYPPTPSPKPIGRERPLSPFRRVLLIAGATAVMLLAYLFCLLALLVVLFMLALDVVLLVPAARVGMAKMMAGALKQQWRLAGLLLRGLQLKEGPDYDIVLTREEAPRLFALAEELAPLVGVPPPAEIRLVMRLNAWVKVRGYRTARASSIVGVGLDLLAALSESEVRAVLAHELGHARFIQPGYKGWLTNALRRITQLAVTLDMRSAPKEAQFLTATALWKGMEIYARTGSKMVAAYSRQHEFDADRIAAEVCGASLYKKALLNVHVAELAAGQITHRERLIQCEREESFPQWLHGRFTPDPDRLSELSTQVVATPSEDPYSTHPPLKDRLDLLPDDGTVLPDSPSALNLLANPESTASRLIVKLEELMSQAEKEENEKLRELIRSGRKGSNVTLVQTAGWLFVLASFVAACSIFYVHSQLPNDTSPLIVLFMISALMLGGGILMVLRGGHKQTTRIPIPPFAKIEPYLPGGDLYAPPKDLNVWRNQALGRVFGMAPVGRNRNARADWWGKRCALALAECDFSLAYGAATKGLAERATQMECLLAQGVVAAYHGDMATIEKSLGKALSLYRLGPSVSWTLGWSLAMVGNWPRAEAYLHDALAHRSGEASIWALVGRCQWEREKLHEAAASLRRAVQINPQDVSQKLVLAQILLDAGRPLECSRLLGSMNVLTMEDRRGPLSFVRVNLLLGKKGEAGEMAARFATNSPNARGLLALASAYAEVKENEEAAVYLQRVRALGHYPEALIGLAYLAHEAKEGERAMSLLREAISLQAPLAGDARGPLEVLHSACRLWASLTPPVRNCKIWVAEVNTVQSAFPAAGLSLVVSAPTTGVGEQIIHALFEAMSPGMGNRRPPVQWSPVPGVEQSKEPVSPGIYGVNYPYGMTR
jgi:Zn-dependent protease with chaperone function/tetratricopeptide (TPR) repeat protein